MTPTMTGFAADAGLCAGVLGAPVPLGAAAELPPPAGVADPPPVLLLLEQAASTTAKAAAVAMQTAPLLARVVR
jgi:hypothetical protein